jgi:hypothetical protein
MLTWEENWIFFKKNLLKEVFWEKKITFAPESAFVSVLPLPVDDLECDVLVGRSGVDPQDDKVLVVRTNGQCVRRSACLKNNFAVRTWCQIYLFLKDVFEGTLWNFNLLRKFIQSNNFLLKRGAIFWVKNFQQNLKTFTVKLLNSAAKQMPAITSLGTVELKIREKY